MTLGKLAQKLIDDRSIRSEWIIRFQVKRKMPRHPWAIRIELQGQKSYRFFQIGWTHEPDYCGRKWPIVLRFHCGGIGSLLWCTHRG